MPEPTSTTAATTTGLAAVSLLPFINGNALLGAVLGAAFVAYLEKNLAQNNVLHSCFYALALVICLALKLRAVLNSSVVTQQLQCLRPFFQFTS